VRIAGPLIESLKVLLMQNFQTAASVLKHRLLHSAKPHPRILPQRGISMKERQWKTNPLSFFCCFYPASAGAEQGAVMPLHRHTANLS